MSNNKDCAERSRVEKIDDFLNQYGRNFKDAPVDKLRNIVPLFLMEVEAERFGYMAKKVRGLWTAKPCHWPDSVPFVDPNNNVKGVDKSNSKPQKEICLQMLQYLNQKIQEKRNQSEIKISQSQLDGSHLMENYSARHVECDSSMLVNSKVAIVQELCNSLQTYSSYLNQSQVSEKVEDDIHYGSNFSYYSDGLVAFGQTEVDLQNASYYETGGQHMVSEQGIVLPDYNCIPVRQGGSVMESQQAVESAGDGEQPEMLENTVVDQMWEDTLMTQLGALNTITVVAQEEENVASPDVEEEAYLTKLVQQVDDSEQNKFEYNPIQESAERISKKLACIEKHHLVEYERYLQLWQSYVDLKMMQSYMDHAQKERLIKDAHNLEQEIDMALQRASFPPALKTQDTNGLFPDDKKMDPSYESGPRSTVQPEADTSVPSTLNIKWRMGVATQDESHSSSIRLRPLSQKNESSVVTESDCKTSEELNGIEPVCEEISLVESDLDLGIRVPVFSQDQIKFFDRCLSGSFLEFKEDQYDDAEYGSGNSSELPSGNSEEFQSFSFSLHNSTILAVSKEGECAFPSGSSSWLESKPLEDAGSQEEFLDPFYFPTKSPSCAISDSLSKVSLDVFVENPAAPKSSSINKRKLEQDIYPQTQQRFSQQNLPTFVEGVDLDDQFFRGSGGKKMKTNK